MQTHRTPTSRQVSETTAVRKDKLLLWFDLAGVRWPRKNLSRFEIVRHFTRLLFVKDVVLIEVSFNEKHHNLMDISIESMATNILYIPVMPPPSRIRTCQTIGLISVLRSPWFFAISTLSSPKLASILEAKSPIALFTSPLKSPRSY